MRSTMKLTHIIAISMSIATGSLALGQESKTPSPPPNEDRWKDIAELSYVVTGGNSRTNTLGFKNKLWRKWEKSGFELNAGGVRAESTTITDYFAVGTASDFSITKRRSTDLTAENYYLNGRYDRKITEKFIWFGLVGWDRNRFSGIDNRYTGAAGVGNLWVDTDRLKFRTDYAATVTKQVDVVDNPDVKETFAGVRVSYAYLQKLGATTTVTSDLALDDDLDDTSDYRANMISSVAVAMSARLALKASVQWLYDHRPSFKSIDLFDPLNRPPTGTPIGSVLVPLQRLDSVVTTSLVINF